MYLWKTELEIETMYMDNNKLCTQCVYMYILVQVCHVHIRTIIYIVHMFALYICVS